MESCCIYICSVGPIEDCCVMLLPRFHPHASAWWAPSNRFYAGMAGFSETCIGPILRVLQLSSSHEDLQVSHGRLKLAHEAIVSKVTSSGPHVDISTTSTPNVRL